jgi:RimJ/RimL family protein N-acetyltransferase
MANEQSPFLVGSLVKLRCPVREDFGLQMQLWMNDKEVTRYLVRGLFPVSLHSLQAEFDKIVSASDEMVFMVEPIGSDRAAGICGLHQINLIARHAEFRILVGEKDAWGRGVGGEALLLLMAYAFRFLGLNKVWLGVNKENTRAHRSYAKVGFREEGILRNEVWRDGRYYDVIRMSMLKSEFEQVAGTLPLGQWLNGVS